MREFTVNLPLHRVELDELIDRAAWVPHITIQSNLTTGSHPDVVTEAVRGAVSGFAPIRAVVTGEALFGPDGAFRVNLVDGPALRAMHDLVHARLRDEADTVSINQAADGDGFRPHVTVTRRGRAQEGDELVLDYVLLAEIGPHGDWSVAAPIALFKL